jgi:magnesium transporter
MLINCVAYQDGEKLADIDVEDISHFVAQPECFVWVALRDASDDELDLMQREFKLHDLAVEDAKHGHQRPKVEEYGDTLFVVMHLVERNAAEQLTVGELNVFVGSNFILSVRDRSQQSLTGVRDRAERAPHLLHSGAAFVLYALMDEVVDRYFPLIESMESDLESIEERIFVPGAARSNIQHLYELKRRIVTVKHAVSPLMESTAKLASSRGPAACEGTREYFRDVSDHVIRINGTLDILRDTIGTAIQVNLSMVTIEESETTKKLAAWAGIFGAATAAAGVWGMNFEHMPELHWQYGYPVALGLIAAMCVLLYRRFRRLGWL